MAGPAPDYGNFAIFRGESGARSGHPHPTLPHQSANLRFAGGGNLFAGLPSSPAFLRAGRPARKPSQNKTGKLSGIYPVHSVRHLAGCSKPAFLPPRIAMLYAKGEPVGIAG